jgi:methylenetetrahydrofolate reductase (NADPH)
VKITEHISQAKRTLFSMEILPPLKGQNIAPIFESLDQLMEFAPAFVDVTYHREEYVYRKVRDGLLEKRTVRKRPGTVGICAAIKHRYHVDPVPHIICGGFNREETEDALLDLNYLGIDNVLVLRGDPIRSEGRFKAENDGHAYASELLEQVIALNQGRYIDPELRNSVQTNFCAGVAGYPEKHYESPNLNTDLRYLKLKVDRGAEYIITQMFFENERYFEFVDRCRAAGINVPIIPGLKPITSKGQITAIPQNFFVNLPDELVEAVERAKSKEEVEAVGIDWCIRQCKSLINAGAPVLHFYTMGKSASTKAIAKAVY